MARFQKIAALAYAVFVIFSACHLLIYSWKTKSTPWNVFEVKTPNRTLYFQPSLPTSMIQRETGKPDLKLTKGYSQTLTIRMTAVPKFINRFYCFMLRSAALFWSPKLGPVSLILDEESEKDHEFAARLREQENSLGFKFNFIFEPLPPNATELFKGFRSFGYNRQLWSFFFMDLYINASIIALTDTDGIFSAPVTPENIFNGNKLRVIGFDWNPKKYVGNWDASARIAIGKPIAADFMAYFPSYIWRSTITNCRNYILKHMNVSTFEEAFRRMYPRKNSPSPVNTVMSYAYYFEHDRYDWHIDVTNNAASYNKRHNMSPDFKIKPNDTFPYPHLAMHLIRFTERYPNPMIQGYCEAQRYVGTLPISCQKFHNATNFQLFEFKTRQNHLDTWCKEPMGRRYCTQLIDSHYKNFVKYYKTGMYDLDLERVFAVERAATEFNVTCPNLGLS